MKHLAILGIFIILIIIASNYKMKENFDTPSINSSSSQINSGASEKYGWDYKPIQHECPKCHYRFKKHCHTTNIQPPPCPPQPIPIPSHTTDCSKCDATQCKNIDKYVLKSSVPPYPDMSKYALKSMIKPNVDLDKYVLKSQVKPCPHQDMSMYILKSEIPSCPKCPKCPMCPRCPKCMIHEHDHQHKHCGNIHDHKHCSNIHQHSGNIHEHQHKDKYILKKDCQSYKESIFDSIEDWFKNNFRLNLKGGSESGKGGPQGYGFGKWTGWGTNNAGYGLAGNKSIIGKNMRDELIIDNQIN